MGEGADVRDEVVGEPNLIGRGRELQRVAAGWRSTTTRGPGSLTVVSGERGLGKTRLCEAAAAQARTEGLPAVVARCWPDGGAPPLWPWQPIVRELCGPEAAALVTELADLANLAGLADGAGPADVVVGAGPAGADDDRRFGLRAALTEHLVAVTAERPACLVIDDLHAADADALQLLRFVVRSSPRPRLAIVVSCRTGPGRPPAGAREARLLDEIESEATPVVLQPLDGPATVRFLQAHDLAGAEALDPDSYLLKMVRRVCGGRPAELQRLAVDAPDLLEGLRRTVRRSMAGLGDESRAILQAAAVLGTVPPVAEIAALADCDRPRVLAAAAEAVRAGLMPGTQPTRLSFGHEQVRAAFEGGLSAPERIDLHARAAALVSGAGAGGDGSALPPAQVLRWAFHAVVAAPRSPADARIAIAACRAAAAITVADGALADADAAVTTAVELHDLDHGALGPAPAALLVDWARAALQRGRLGEARERFERAAAVADQEGDPAVRAEAALGLGGQWVNEHRTPLERARILGRQRSARLLLLDDEPGADEAGGPGDGRAASLRVRLDVRLAAEAVYDGDPVAPVLAALERARALGDAGALGEALSLTHHVLLAPEHAHRRLDLADELIRVAAGGDPALGLLGLGWRTVDLFLLGADRAGRSLEVLRERATALDHGSLRHLVDVLDVMLLIRAGRLDDAEAAAHRAHHRGRDVGEVDAASYLCIHLLVIRWLQDRHGELADAAEAMVGSAAVATGEFAFRASAAVAAARAGRLDRARSELDALLAGGVGALPPSSSWLTGLTSIVDLAVSLDDPAVARQAYDLIAPYADRPVLPSLAVACLGSAERWLGLAARTWGDGDLAGRHLERAVQANLALDHRPMVAMTRAELAGVLADRGRPGDTAAAAELLDLAVTAAEAMGMTRRAAAWRDLRNGLPSAPPPAPPSPPSRNGNGHAGGNGHGPGRTPARSAAAPVQPNGAHRGDNGPAPPGPRQGTVRRRGRGWLIVLDHRRVRLPDLVGVGYLVELLRNPGRRIPALALIAGPAAVPEVLHHGDHHDLLDDQARAAYADRLVELTGELDEAEAYADLGRADRLRVEIDALVEQLEAATGLAGRSRSFAHSPERARTAVRKAITRALDRIDGTDPVVGTALRTVIATGTTCSYEPTADPTTTWTVTPTP